MQGSLHDSNTKKKSRVRIERTETIESHIQHIKTEYNEYGSFISCADNRDLCNNNFLVRQYSMVYNMLSANSF